MPTHFFSIKIFFEKFELILFIKTLRFPLSLLSFVSTLNWHKWFKRTDLHCSKSITTCDASIALLNSIGISRIILAN
jgi:hypothetical protein